MRKDTLKRGHRTIPLRAITFDVGGTLIAPWPSVGDVYAQVAAEHAGRDFPVEVLNRQFRQAWRRLKDFRHTREQWAALVEASFRDLIEPGASRSFFPAIYDRFAQPQAWRIYDDVLPTLQALAGAGLRLGVISNWDERLRPLLGRLGLLEHFQEVVVSCEVGVPKPGRAIFRAAARRLGLPPAAILHVGDSREMDYEGARAAGLRGAWLDRSGRSGGGRGRVRTLLELADVR